MSEEVNTSLPLTEVTVFPAVLPIMSQYPGKTRYLVVYRQHFQSNTCMLAVRRY